jgi:hypothetical protein
VQVRRRGEPRGTGGEEFLKLFGKPDRLLACECERSDDSTLAQAFQLVSGDVIDRLLSDPHNRIGRLMAAGKSTAEIIEELYFASLSRMPVDLELVAAVDYVERAPNRREALEDVTWGLVSAKEFLLRH